MKEVTSSFNANEVEARIRRFWADEDTYRKVRELRQDGQSFFFVDGPPYTTGNIHLGTAWNKIIKDCILRQKRMTGRNVIDRAGYDMHGLPIEVSVEHELGFKSKKDIETFGIANFIEKCREFALEHKDSMNEQFRELGIWMDFDNPYQTIMPEFIEAAWLTVKRASEKGLLEQGHRVVNWCPRCGTAIADSEVEYWDETDPSVYVRFPVRGRENEYLVIWTTTPWTLPANVAIAVKADFRYARVRAVKDGKEEILWIAEELADALLKKAHYQKAEVLSTISGAELAGTVYDSPLADLVPAQKETPHRVITADHVTMENTGLVHTAPGHGWDDYLAGIKENLPTLCPVDGAGVFTEEAGVFEGKYVRDANQDVIEALGDYLLMGWNITHRYGHCWRCKTPIISRSTDQWFIAIPKIKKQMLEEIAKTNWYPEWAGSARFHDFVAGARDWCISRQRYWGIPIPVWKCEKCGEMRVFGTVAELNEASGANLTDPHRPYVDEVTVPCACGGTMHRVEDIFDVWFDSAMASWATINYPREKEAFEKLWPADLIIEGQDQTRGWFYSQLGASVINFDRAPYKNVMMHGFALDSNGRKMSKSVGNVITPSEVMDKVGVDVLRLYILSANAPWDDLKFNWDSVKTVNRAANILWNVYRFPLPYMLLDGFEPECGENKVWDAAYVRAHINEMPVEDRWIISRINSLAETVTEATEKCELHVATRALISCVLDDISRWYVQIVRPRMWLEEDAVEKVQAYETMYYVIRTFSTLLAPFAPHLAEEIYQNLRCEGDMESIHMITWPRGEETLTDAALEEEMAVVQAFDEAASAARQEGKRKLRWPVAEITVITDSDVVADTFENLGELCRSRSNSRKVSVVKGRWERMGWNAEPVMRVIGPEFGREGPKIKAAVEAADGDALKAALDAEGSVEVGGYTLTEKHLTFEERLPENVFSASMKDANVCVDITLSDDIEAEGFAREVIRRLQEMRRQLDLNVEDFISASVQVADSRILGLLGDWKDGIMHEVRAESLELTGTETGLPEAAHSQEWEVEGTQMRMAISRSVKD